MFLLILVKKHTKKINFSLGLQSIICHFCDQKYFVIFASLFSLFLLSLRKRNQNARAVPKKLKIWYKFYSALNSGNRITSSKICICSWLLYFGPSQSNLARNRRLRIYIKFSIRFLRNARLPSGFVSHFTFHISHFVSLISCLVSCVLYLVSIYKERAPLWECSFSYR